MSAAIRAALHRYYTAVWQDGDIAALDELLTSDYVDHDPLPGFGAGLAAAKTMAAQVTSAMPGARLQVHHLIVEGELAAAHWSMTWRSQHGPGGGQLRGHDFFRMRGNRIREVWHCEKAQG